MPIRHAIWKVASSPEPLLESRLSSEQLLEDMIVAQPRLLSDEWMLIGRQEDTGHGGRIDLLAVAPDGALVLIELKGGRTPREVVAQALDYASWVDKLRAEEVAAIYARYAPGRSLGADFKARFGHELDEETLNQTHQIVIVAASLDPSSERIVAYLRDRDIAVNVLCFQVFAHGEDQLISRAWLLDPVETQLIAQPKTDGPREPWNGEFYSSFGADDGGDRLWEEARQYGFISGGGGAWYSKTLQLLNPGDRVWVKIPGYGFVGVAKVLGRVQPASEFKVQTSKGERLALDVLKGTYHRQHVNDPERAEFFVPVQWLDTVPQERAVNEVGLFGNQNTVCKPTTPKWRSTVERLKERFPGHAK